MTLLFIDDDDRFARGAFEIMRRFARDNPDRIGVFRMRNLDGRLLWKEPVLRRTNVSSQMFCVPNTQQRLGSWTGHEELTSPSSRRYDVADYEFIARTSALQGAAEAPVTESEPRGNGADVHDVRHDHHRIRRRRARAASPRTWQ